MSKVDELTSIYKKHIGVFIHMAKKYHFLDSWEEIISCGHVGFMLAIDEYEKSNVKLATLLFKNIKKVIIDEYFKKNRERERFSNSSIDTPINDDGDSLSSVISDSSFSYGAKHIESLVCEALFESSQLEKDIVTKYLLHDYEIEDLASIYNMPERRIRLINRRGYHLIKLYLYNNDLISDWAMEPTTNNKVKHISKPEALTEEQSRQLKFIRQTYMNLTRTDYANILDCDIRSINYTLDYPTTTFIRYGLDDSIDDKVKQYIEERYPDTLPGEVKVYEMV